MLCELLSCDTCLTRENMKQNDNCNESKDNCTSVDSFDLCKLSDSLLLVPMVV